MRSLRNLATDLVLPKPKREFGKRSFKYNGAIQWNSLLTKQRVRIPLLLFKRIINPQRVEAVSTSS